MDKLIIAAIIVAVILLAYFAYTIVVSLHAGVVDPTKVTFYQGVNFTNPLGSFGVGNYDIGAITNDAANSVAVPAGYSVQMFQDAGYSGASKGASYSIADLSKSIMVPGTSWANQISSFKVVKN